MARRASPLTIGIVSLVALMAFEGVDSATAMPVLARELNGCSGDAVRTLRECAR